MSSRTKIVRKYVRKYDTKIEYFVRSVLYLYTYSTRTRTCSDAEHDTYAGL